MNEKLESSVLIIAPDSPLSFSPAGERVRHLAIASRKFFLKETVVLTLKSMRSKEKPSEMRRANEGVSLYDINLKRASPYPFSAYLDPVKLVLLLIYATLLVCRHRPGYVVASLPPLEVGVSAWIASKICHANLIVDLRDDWEKALEVMQRRRIPPALFRPLFKLARRIYFNSTGMLVVTRSLSRTISERGVNTSIIYAPNGADASLFSLQSKKIQRKTRLKYSLPQNKIVVVYAGSGRTSYYRLDLLLLALANVTREIENRGFLVFYVYNDADRLRERAKDLNIPPNILAVREALPREDLAEVLSTCDVGLVPFDDNQFLQYAMSTKFYEYVSAGLYVVCSGPKGGELNMILSNKPYLGTFVQPTVGNFVRSLLRILSSPQDILTDSLRNKRHSFIEELYDRQKIMELAWKDILSAKKLSS
jgi:glycosyltransferase involved in cell wall biosynthesis